MLFVPPSIPFMVPSAFAQTPTTLILDPLPSVAQVGDTVVFSGQLLTANGEFVITDATIYIKDDVSFGTDTVYGTLTTDNNGEFYATWTAVQRSSGGSYDFYAIFEGAGNIDYSRSQTYSVTVTTAPTPTPIPTAPTGPTPLTLILNSLPSTVQAGNTITFSGILMTADQQRYISNETIYIKDDSFGIDPTIKTVKTNDESGEFVVTWTAIPRSSGGSYDFYAIFEGHARL